MNKDKLPGLSEIRKKMQMIAKKNNLGKQVVNTWKHSRVVWKFAETIAGLAINNGYTLDLNFLKIGCFIHDIGRVVTGSKGSTEIKDPIYHFYEGYYIMKKWGYPKLARVCVCHACGGGLDRKTNIKNGFLARDYFPTSIEEKIIAYSDARTDYKKGIGPTIWPIAKAYGRYKVYPGSGARLMANRRFISKITNHKIK